MLCKFCEVKGMKKTVSWFFALLIMIIPGVFIFGTQGLGRVSQKSETQPRFLTYRSGLCELRPKGQTQIEGNRVLFHGGYEVVGIANDERSRIFPDSIYPIPKQYKNDSSRETVLALPTGRRRYSVVHVETLISGKFAQEILTPEKGTRSFFFDANEKRAGLLKFTGADSIGYYFIYPF